ncbi:SLAP domain-containing protein [Clostridium sp. ZS2-4]|uniref:SLAP domain-containing protein n=1 Tax=Clostridium sp. ZS2-4 TaxID=2987703 RepID=UPI00227BDBF6|nr:SLAP domain-containing protein [Clostridium sp. ZS2-4]MCY6355450.1 SLAP domain-containing protein [Clostridium sp. ZS2-4]
MKKITSLIVIFIILFSGCNSSAAKSYKDGDNIKKQQKEQQEQKEQKEQKAVINQQYSFGPAADLSVIDDETKKEIQEFLNKLGDVPKDTISFNSMGLRYLEEGEIVIDLLVRNGYSYSIFNLDVKLDIVVNEEVVASENFFFSKEDFGVLPPNMSRPWSIIYYPEEIKNDKIKLENYTIKSTYQYEF